jgi:hypothetical protein
MHVSQQAAVKNRKGSFPAEQPLAALALTRQKAGRIEKLAAWAALSMFLMRVNRQARSPAAKLPPS